MYLSKRPVVTPFFSSARDSEVGSETRGRTMSSDKQTQVNERQGRLSNNRNPFNYIRAMSILINECECCKERATIS